MAPMSEIAVEARQLAARLLPTGSGEQPELASVREALAQLQGLSPRDAHDEVALHEAADTLLQLLEVAEPRDTSR